MLSDPFHLTFDPLNSSQLSSDGRLLAPLASLSNWFFLPGVIDLATGQITRIPADQPGDYHAIARLQDSQVVAGANELRSALWKFTPEKP